MTYEIVVSKATVDAIGYDFSFCGSLLMGIAPILLGIFVYKFQDNMLTLPVRVIVAAVLFFMGISMIVITILKTLGIILIVSVV